MILKLKKEPVGLVYKSLLDFALRRCQSFSFVWRDQMEFERSASDFEVQIRSHLASEKRSNEWPGTWSASNENIVRRYHCEENSINKLARVNGVYSWIAPQYPEDIVFYLPNGNPWFVSIAHEKTSWFEGEIEIIEDVIANIPGLKMKGYLEV